MSVEGAGRPPESPSGPSLPPAAPAAPYRRLAGLAPWISWLLLILAAAYAISTVMTLAVYGFGEYSTPARIDRFSSGEVAISVIGFVQSGIALAVAVLFIIWFYRAYDNLRAVTSAGPRRSPGWTIGAWFVPHPRPDPAQADARRGLVRQRS